MGLVTLDGEPAPDVQLAPALPSSLGPYRVEAFIGKGGMGLVYRGRKPEPDGFPVAIKVLRPELMGQVTAEVRFAREGLLAARLAHPNLCPVLDVGKDGALVYLVMPLVEGENLGSLVAAARRSQAPTPLVLEALEDEAPWRRIVRMGERLGRGLQSAHEHGLVHRDIKPGNVIVRPDGEPVLLDFGLARELEDGGAGLTGTEQVMGTPLYLTPEQADPRGRRADARTDVHALAATLFECLTLRLPHEATTYAGLVRHISAEPATLLRTLNRDLPRDLEVVLQVALETAPERRYATAGLFTDDLQRVLRGERPQARRPAIVRRALDWVGRNRIAAALIATIATGLVASLVLASRLRAEVDRRRVSQAALEHEHLITEVDDLWPAIPERIPAFERWIQHARTLAVDMPSYRAERNRLRALALPPRSDDEGALEAAHLLRQQLLGVESRIVSVRNALARRKSGTDPVFPTLRAAELQLSPHVQREMAWTLVDPARTRFGEEARGLALLRSAQKLVDPATGFTAAAVRMAALPSVPGPGLRVLLARTRSLVRVTDPGFQARFSDALAWAYFALGRDEEARAWSAEAIDRAPPDHRVLYEYYQRRLAASIDSASSEQGMRDAELELAALLEERDTLARAMEERLEWRFEDSGDGRAARLRHARVAALVDDMETFGAGSGLLSNERGATAGDRGWSVSRRLTHARELSEAMRPGGAHARRWKGAIEAIRDSPKYGGKTLAPQQGLVPIGADPESGLWEFWHTATGAEPRRGPDDELALSEDMGVVLVLIPDSTFWMGAQKANAEEGNYDPRADSNELPPHEVELTWYFLSKFEVTQGQWLHFTGSNPSQFQPPHVFVGTLLHPLENVSWFESERILGRMGLRLPTEAEWEHACRGGTRSPWWTGADRDSLVTGRAGNLGDAAAQRAGLRWGHLNWKLDDGSVLHAPVGTYAANPFGLHDVHGNVAEWCADHYVRHYYLVSPRKDPVATVPDALRRVWRGGAFMMNTLDARSSERANANPSFASQAFGLRPARAVEP
ncbi:MAG: SUMF1/EgtB/PvdO family nonheme iron enzyme [bacterium]|nr:SUMF1/EgtB/PvdO family nonheme iron enzyme [bacterium]